MNIYLRFYIPLENQIILHPNRLKQAKTLSSLETGNRVMKIIYCSGKPANPPPEPPSTSEDVIRSGIGKLNV